MNAPLALPVLVNGVPLLVELTPEAVATLRAALGAVEGKPVPSQFMTPGEAADLLRCNRRRIYDLVGNGRLPRYGDGRRLLVRRGDVLALAEGSPNEVTHS